MKRIIITETTDKEVYDYLGYRGMNHYLDEEPSDFYIRGRFEDGMVVLISNERLEKLPFEYEIIGGN